MKQVWPSSLGINLSQLEQFLLQLCRIQVLLVGKLVQDELELGCLSLLHEHVGVTDGGAGVQQPPHHALHNRIYGQKLQMETEIQIKIYNVYCIIYNEMLRTIIETFLFPF